MCCINSLKANYRHSTTIHLRSYNNNTTIINTTATTTINNTSTINNHKIIKIINLNHLYGKTKPIIKNYM
jgi:hypothetical protein